MANNIYQMQNALRYGSARPTQFRVIFPESNLSTDQYSIAGSDASAMMSVLCKSASIPASTIQDIPLFYRGRQYHEAGEPDFQPWNCTFYNEGSFTVRGMLEEWSNTIQHRNDIGGETRVSAYKRDILVQQLDRNGKILRQYNLIGAYPTNVSQIDLSYENGQAVEEFSVDFQYDYFTITKGTTGAVESYNQVVSSSRYGDRVL